MSYNLNSLKGVIWGMIYGTTIEVIWGDTRSLDYSSYNADYVELGDTSSVRGGRRFAEHTMHNRSVYAWLQNIRTRMISICLTFFIPIMPL